MPKKAKQPGEKRMLSCFLLCLVTCLSIAIICFYSLASFDIQREGIVVLKVRIIRDDSSFHLLEADRYPA